MEAPARPRLDAAALHEELGRLRPPYTLELRESVTSTNAVASERARGGAGDRLVVVAEHQTAGRGRLGRTWESPPRAGLTFSLLLWPDLHAAAWPWLPLLTGYAVGRALRGLGVAAGLKWPNDVLVDDRKLAGILVERIESPRGAAAVVGVGLNVSTTRAELPAGPVTSLQVASPGAWDRARVLVAVLQSFTEEYAAWRAPGGEAGLRRAYAAGCVTLGVSVEARLPGGGTLRGRAVEVDTDGRLVLETARGREVVAAGDVVHLRPAGGHEGGPSATGVS